MRRWPAVIIASAVAIGAMLFILAPAFARDPQGIHANSEHHEWYGQQHNENGEWCCDKSDGHAYYGAVTINPDGSIILDGGHKLPAYMVLKGPNPTGHAVWWFTENAGGHTDYCFSPGMLS